MSDQIMYSDKDLRLAIDARLQVSRGLLKELDTLADRLRWNQKRIEALLAESSARARMPSEPPTEPQEPFSDPEGTRTPPQEEKRV